MSGLPRQTGPPLGPLLSLHSSLFTDLGLPYVDAAPDVGGQEGSDTARGTRAAAGQNLLVQRPVTLGRTIGINLVPDLRIAQAQVVEGRYPLSTGFLHVVG